MAHDERMLSQSEIDSLLKRILPKTDEPATKDKPAPAMLIESPAKPKEAAPIVKPVASVKAAEPVKPKEAVPPVQVPESIKMTEYKMKAADTPPSSRLVEAIKGEASPNESASLQKTVADLSVQVSKLTAAMQTITKLEEKVKQLEAQIKLMPDSNRTLKGRIDEISNVLEMLKDEKSDHTFLEGFKCSHCHSRGLVAMYVKCTGCGKESWLGWWPEKSGE